MQRIKSTLAYLALAGILAGCDLGDGPVAPDPCRGDLACQVFGVDVALLGVLPRWMENMPYDAELGAHVIEPGDTLVVDVLIANLGTRSPEDSIIVYGLFRDFQHFVEASTRIAPLEVGQNGYVRLSFVVPDGVRWVIEPWSETLAIGEFGLAGDFVAEDVDPANHIGPPVNYHPRVPVLDVAHIVVADTLRAHTPYEALVSVTNRSPFVSYPGGDQLVFCLSHLGHGYCELGQLETAGSVTLGPVNPRQTGQFVGALEFGGESLWYFDSESAVFVNPCLPGTPRTCLHRAASENDYDVALPDLVQECHTVPLTPPDTLRATESLCLVSHGADAGTAHTIGVFSGAEGDCFRVTRLGDQWSATVVDANFVPVTRDAAADCHRLPHSGQYYLKAYSTAAANPAGGIVAIQPI